MYLYEQTVQLFFNTDVTSPPNSRPDYASHTMDVERLLERIMEHPGMTSCWIGVHDIQARFMPSITDKPAVVKAVAEAIEWAANQPELKLFPKRGELTPGLVKLPGQGENLMRLTASYNTSIIAFQPSDQEPGAADVEKFAKRTYRLAKALSDLDGVTQCEIQLHSVQLTFNTLLTPADMAHEHMLRVLTGAKRRRMRGIFPYIAGPEQLELEFYAQNM